MHSHVLASDNDVQYILVTELRFPTPSSPLLIGFLSWKCIMRSITLHLVNRVAEGRRDTSSLQLVGTNPYFLLSTQFDSLFQKWQTDEITSDLPEPYLKRSADIPGVCGNLTCLCKLTLTLQVRTNTFWLVWMTQQGSVCRPIDFNVVTAEITQGVKTCGTLLILQWTERARSS